MTIPARKSSCPACGASMNPFFELSGLATGSSVVLETREAALNFPRGDLVLAFCQDCGFVSNLAFSPTLASDAARHEDSQAYSGTYSRYLRELAEDLVQRKYLHGKRIAEIGCGQGEFLALLCELGPNEGIGFDPVFERGRGILDDRGDVRVFRECYDERQAPLEADLVCCKMTLEHIHAVAPFVALLRRAVAGRPDAMVYVQVPEAHRILKQCAFEDVYYEHCSYFTPGTLARLFRSQGFAVERLNVTYGGQYLSIEAHPGPDPGDRRLSQEEPVADVAVAVADFARGFAERTAHWRQVLEARAAEGPVVIWGSGSKAVSFMKGIGAGEWIRHVVDVNPYRQGRFVACTGQRIMAPAEVAPLRPRTVVVMNSIYIPEVAATLRASGVETELLGL